MADSKRSRCPQTVAPGDRVRLELPFSEVCIHLRVAGRVMTVGVIGGSTPTAQLYDDEGRTFSFPVLASEAGIHSDRGQLYCYPAVDVASEASS